MNSKSFFKDHKYTEYGSVKRHYLSRDLKIANSSIWLEHPDYPGYRFSPEGFCLSIHGRPKSVPSYLKKNGYLQFNLSIDGKMESILAHRVIAEVFLKAPTDFSKTQINHKNANKQDNHIENLEWVSAFENVQHRDKLKLQKRYKGNECSWSKLTEEDVIEIKQLLKQKLFHKDIAEKFNVKRETISRISQGKNWKHIKLNSGGLYGIG